WKEQVRQNRALQAKEHIRLILLWIGGAMQFSDSVALEHSRIMAGGDVVSLHLPAVSPELAELEPAVADDARIRRAAGEILVGEIIDDAIEFALEIERVEWDIQLVGDAPGIAGIDGAATSLFVIGPAIFGPVDAGA